MTNITWTLYGNEINQPATNSQRFYRGYICWIVNQFKGLSPDSNSVLFQSHLKNRSLLIIYIYFVTRNAKGGGVGQKWLNMNTMEINYSSNGSPFWQNGLPFEWLAHKCIFVVYSNFYSQTAELDTI